MTLARRLSWYFLAALGAVLGGFSLGVYVLVDRHLDRRATERLEATLATLAAYCETTPAGLEWERQDRLPVGDVAAGQTAVPWWVLDERDRVVDRAPFQAVDPSVADAALAKTGATGCELLWHDEPWRFRQFRLRPPDSSVQPADEVDEPAAPVYAALTIRAGVSLAADRGELRGLAWGLAALAATTWTLALLASRWICRRALAPIGVMARAARSIQADRLESRMPTPTDGDELARLAVAFNDLLSRLQESFERQRRFTGDAAHQLRTPLAALTGHLDVALRRDRPAEEYQQALRTAQSQVERLRQMVEALLFLARSEGESLPLSTGDVELGAWLADHLRDWQGHARASDLQVVVDPSTPCLVAVSAPLLAQAVDNLLSNACKYSPRHSAITLAVSRRGPLASLSVEDRGGGLASEELPHLFEPFFRGSQARLRGVEGVGLGLAVAQRIARALQGHIEVQVVAGQGCRFTLWLPIAGAAAASARDIGANDQSPPRLAEVSLSPTSCPTNTAR